MKKRTSDRQGHLDKMTAASITARRLTLAAGVHQAQPVPCTGNRTAIGIAGQAICRLAGMGVPECEDVLSFSHHSSPMSS